MVANEPFAFTDSRQSNSSSSNGSSRPREHIVLNNEKKVVLMGLAKVLGELLLELVKSSGTLRLWSTELKSLQPCRYRRTRKIQYVKD